MKAILKLKGIEQFSCNINDKLSTMTSFSIHKNAASAALLNALSSLNCLLMERFEESVNVHVENKFIESLTFVD